MKRLLVVFSLFLVISANSQFVQTVDTSFHPVIDTSITSITACNINPIKAELSNDTARLVTINVISDNLSNLANICFSFLKIDLTPIKSITFTVQGKNYSDWNSNEYLFKLVATFLNNTIGLRLSFR